MARIWHRKNTTSVRRGLAEPLPAIRKLMNWDPFLDLDVAKVAREAEPVFTPSFDILETGGYYAFLADLPGLRQEDLEVTWTAGRITIAGAREPEALGEGADYYALERTFGRFSRSFSLPAGVCVDKTNAMLKDGVLTVLVPKDPAGRPGRIPIQDSIPLLG
jgi:HSP20 family protein